MMQKNPSLALWLLTCAAAVFLMALIGAATRLTESGLSIVQWNPVTGALPPFNAESWGREFALYQATPQYLKINHGMTLDEFKSIYLWEWVHRLWGRVIGLLYAVPFIYFLVRQRLPRAALPGLSGILLLGFAQGALGWYMVKSGLIDRPAVSHYRLAAHLMLAVFLYACLLRLGARLLTIPQGGAAHLRGMVRAALALAALTMTWGAFVAGLRAGLVYNTFPTMNGQWIPLELFAHTPHWLAFFEEPATVQFTHRCLALVTWMMTLALSYRLHVLQTSLRLTRLARALAVAATTQVALGVATLLTHVNILLAVAHQAGALTLIGLLVWLWHETSEGQEKE